MKKKWKNNPLIFDIENEIRKYDFGSFWQTGIHCIHKKKILWWCWFLAQNLLFRTHHLWNSTTEVILNYVYKTRAIVYYKPFRNFRALRLFVYLPALGLLSTKWVNIGSILFIAILFRIFGNTLTPKAVFWKLKHDNDKKNVSSISLLHAVWYYKDSSKCFSN